MVERTSSGHAEKAKAEKIDKATHRSSEGGSEEIEADGAIKEVFFPEWLSNTMVVKKKNGKWRVCVDFTNLN